jgi:hypothetical protein
MLPQMDYYNRYRFATKTSPMPNALMCPGSKAAEFFSCYGHPDTKGATRSSRSTLLDMMCRVVLLLTVMHCIVQPDGRCGVLR